MIVHIFKDKHKVAGDIVNRYKKNGTMILWAMSHVIEPSGVKCIGTLSTAL